MIMSSVVIRLIGRGSRAGRSGRLDYLSVIDRFDNNFQFQIPSFIASRSTTKTLSFCWMVSLRGINTDTWGNILLLASRAAYSNKSQRQRDGQCQRSARTMHVDYTYLNYNYISSFLLLRKWKARQGAFDYLNTTKLCSLYTRINSKCNIDQL